MNSILKPVGFNERSFHVTILHKALEALGLPVSKEEVAKGKAGQDTLKKVRALQGRLNVPVDDSVVMDEATALAIATALEEKGLTKASRSFTVTGDVKLLNGAVKKRQKLLAFDLDLRGVSVYRNIKSIQKIEKNGGFEFLGEAVSNNLGNYQLTFYDWQYGRAERKKADVVVYAFEDKEIIGRSRMVNSEDYSETGLVRGLDVFIEIEDKRTEYKILMQKLAKFLKESKTSLQKIALSDDQLAFTAGELDIDRSHLDIAASAELLVKKERTLSHELLYGMGRQGIRLSWTALYKKHDEELLDAIAKSEDERIIRKFKEPEKAAFLQKIEELSVTHLLADTKGENTLNAMLSNALSDEKQRRSFLVALRNFKGRDFHEFWNKYLPAQPEFNNKKLIDSLLLTQRLTLLTGNHQALVRELRTTEKITSVRQLFDLEKKDWLKIVKKTGVPGFVKGKDDGEKMERYVDQVQNVLNAAFPALRIAKMIKENEVPIEKTVVAKKISDFLSRNEKFDEPFDFAGSRVHDFKKVIKKEVGDDHIDEVIGELKKIQRVFQVSTSPEAMKVLMKSNLHSAHTVANIPRKNFIKRYGDALGGEEAAFAVHQRASHIATRSEMNAMHLMEYSHGLAPRMIMDPREYKAAMDLIGENMPNPSPSYVSLFGSPDVCECKHCRSVYSPAAYLVDLLRFLDQGTPNDEGKSPLDVLKERRPDLLHLPLTCENSNANIPYIDLANEVMECYVAKGSLDDFTGYDTGEATAEELRANPQNVNPEAYRILKDSKYPFSLPYHQPLDIIRTYTDHLKVSRYEVMKAMNPEPDDDTARVMAAESLRISQEEYTMLADDTAEPHGYFGYSSAEDFADMQDETDADGNPRGIRVLLERTGLKYTDLVELTKTLFINPHQNTFDFLQKLLSHTSVDTGTLDADTFYTKLKEIEAGTLDPVDDNVIMAALNSYNRAEYADITAGYFAKGVADNLDGFRKVITLYEPDSKCALQTTRLRTIQSIYEVLSDSGITNETWSKMHRFIRLWRKLGWTIHETDLVLSALGESNITPDTIGNLGSVLSLKTAAKQPLDKLAVLWGNIDTHGEKSLYEKLFLNKAVQQIDEAFKNYAWGNYLQRERDENDEPITLAEHQAAILAAFRITEEELNAVYGVAEVIDGGNHRNLKPDDILNIQNLSILYRHVVLAKALKIRLADLCKLIDLFGASPFSIWDIQQGKFTEISPKKTLEFYKLAASTKAAGFKPSTLEYILRGTLPADSTIGLDREKTLQTARTIREALAAIDQDHPETPESPTVEAVTAKLSLTFQPEVVSRLMEIMEGNAIFQSRTDDNLNMTIPDKLSEKYTYTKGNGWLACAGIMTDAERDTLKGLTNTSDNFRKAVDELYAAPEAFIGDNFKGIFSNLGEAKNKLIDRSEQDAQNATSLSDKLTYVYKKFLPVLKSKLRRDAVTQHIATLIGLTVEATALLIADDIDDIIIGLSTKGFSADYFNTVDWQNSVTSDEPKTDSTIDFSWGIDAPASSVSADNFSVRWKAYIAAPASGEYTLLVDVEQKDEVFNLYLDGKRILKKEAGNEETSWEKTATFNSARMHLLVLEYAEASDKAGVRLRWKRATTAPEIVPSSVACPAAVLDKFVEQTTVFHRAAQFISGFRISETELDHFLTYGSDFSGIDFKALTPEQWRRINDYVTLRNAVPQAGGLLTDLFSLANSLDPVPTIDRLTEMLHLATAWDKSSLQYLTNHFNLSVEDFRNEKALNRIRKVMQIVSRTGISAETMAKWGSPETDFDALHDMAELIKRALKAKYEEKEWLKIAGNLSDKIRRNQQRALIAHLLVQKEVREWGVVDADGLFEYLLIDVQMGSCMDTSRIVQANAAIQMFVNRCLLNMEKDVSPSAIDKDRWEWMKNYRVWEANRKVFLYPENWLEPEWRNDRSEFFRELESYLVQNDITKRSVEQAFRNYLSSLNEVANLEVCGMHREDEKDGKLKYLHVFARTHNAPYKYYYRRWNKYGKWSPWEKVSVDIRSVEDGDNSGVHLIPVVWKKRLFLFWPEFMEKQRTPSSNSTQSVQSLAGKPMSNLEPEKYWEIRLAWSEYVDEKWSPKQVSKEFVLGFFHKPLNGPLLKDFVFSVQNTGDNKDELTISVYQFPGFYVITIGEIAKTSTGVPIYGPTLVLPAFNLSDIQSSVRISNSLWPAEDKHSYTNNFYCRETNGRLVLDRIVYLRNPVSHKLLPVDTIKGLNVPLDNPFFFIDSDHNRTYFVRPAGDVTITEWVKRTIRYPVYLPEAANYDDFSVSVFDRAAAIPESARRISLASGRVGDIGDAGGSLASTRIMRPAGGSTAVTTRPAIKMEISSVAEPFSGAGYMIEHEHWVEQEREAKSLEFHTFYHPFSSTYVENLNRGGLSRGNKPQEYFPPGLMDSDTEIPSDDGRLFEIDYSPNIDNGLVRKPSDFEERTYYKENVCFDVYGANSLYNWELFFHAPLYIATRLSRNGKYEEAMKWFHYIFDPTTDEMPGEGESELSRYWKVLPFKTTPSKNLEGWFRDLNRESDPNSEKSRIVSEWRDNPFDSHLVAGNRPLSYMKHVVVKYVENLLAWGDSLFRQFTRDSVYEALQIYVIANHVLGPKPEFVPRRGKIKAESYASLSDKWDAFSNALVELENIFPYSSEVGVSGTSTGSLLGAGTALYFCIPHNKKLLDLWNTVEDRLFKIRHCQDIDGVERKLALFAPPISPEALIQAASRGLSIGSILADLSSPPPLYRFSFLIQKANEFCGEVKALGSSLLAAMEKKDTEELSRLRSSHETRMLDMLTTVKERQVLDAMTYKESLLKSRETAKFRFQHYMELLGNEPAKIPDPQSLPPNLTADSSLPADTRIATVKTDVDDSLVDSDERGVKLIAKEKKEIDKNNKAKNFLEWAGESDTLAGIFNMIYTGDVDTKPVGVGIGASWGGLNVGNALSAVASGLRARSQFLSAEAALAAKMASYIRREQDWTLQANLAAKEIIQLDKQITSADIRIQVAEKELDNHRQQIENAREVELFLKDKFTNRELYQWMKEQLFAVYRQSYNLAYDMAVKTEKAYKYELGKETVNFIQYGYWDSSKEGLVAGEKLQQALRQLEKSYLEENRRELELTKSISLALQDPLALIKLRENGKCYLSIPEELFDLDFQGHYFRRIKSVSLSIPCIAGPYTTVNCSLRLLKNSIRINTSMNNNGEYEHENDEGLWIDDERFRSNNVPVTSIATSTGQNDAGMFEFNFRDERYLPFEGAGVISDWQIELTKEKEFRQFDYNTISDVILHIKYTAREDTGAFKEAVITHLKKYFRQDRSTHSLRMFNLRQEFPNQWHAFLNPAKPEDGNIFDLEMSPNLFPVLDQGKILKVNTIWLLARCTNAGSYELKISPPLTDESNNMMLSPDNQYGGLHFSEKDAKAVIKAMPTAPPVTWKLTMARPGGGNLQKDEVKDMTLVLGYEWEDPEDS